MKIKNILQSVFLTLLTLVLVFLVVARAELKEASLASYEAVPAMAAEPTPSPSPTASPTPTPEPTPTPTPDPEDSPDDPIASPTPDPSSEPTPEPSLPPDATPSPEPSPTPPPDDPPDDRPPRWPWLLGLLLLAAAFAARVLWTQPARTAARQRSDEARLLCWYRGAESALYEIGRASCMERV